MAVCVSVGAAILLFAPAPAGGFEAPSFVGVAEGVNVMVGVGVSVATTTAGPGKYPVYSMERAYRWGVPAVGVLLVVTEN